MSGIYSRVKACPNRTSLLLVHAYKLGVAHDVTVEMDMSASRPRLCSSTHHSECRLRIVLIGDSGVGKSSFLTKYIDDSFDLTLTSTCGIDFKRKTLTVDGKTVHLSFWDTAGQERYWSVAPNFCRKANGIILFYDITDFKSFEDVAVWRGKVSNSAPSDVEPLLLGSKLDLQGEREVSRDMGATAARSIDAPFFEVSAVTGENLEEAIHALVRNILRKQQDFVGYSEKTTSRNSVIRMDEDGRQRRNSFSACCSHLATQ